MKIFSIKWNDIARMFEVYEIHDGDPQDSTKGHPGKVIDGFSSIQDAQAYTAMLAAPTRDLRFIYESPEEQQTRYEAQERQQAEMLQQILGDTEPVELGRSDSDPGSLQ